MRIRINLLSSRTGSEAKPKRSWRIPHLGYMFEDFVARLWNKFRKPATPLLQPASMKPTPTERFRIFRLNCRQYIWDARVKYYARRSWRAGKHYWEAASAWSMAWTTRHERLWSIYMRRLKRSPQMVYARKYARVNAKLALKAVKRQNYFTIFSGALLILAFITLAVWSDQAARDAMNRVRDISSLFNRTYVLRGLWVIVLLVFLAGLVSLFRKTGWRGRVPTALPVYRRSAFGTAVMILLLLAVGFLGWRRYTSEEMSSGGQNATPKTVMVKTIIVTREWSPWIPVPDGYHLAFDRTEIVAFEMETPSIKTPVPFMRELTDRVSFSEDIEALRFRVIDKEVPVVAIILRFWPIGTLHPDKPVIPPAPEPKVPEPAPQAPETAPVIEDAPDLTVAGVFSHG